MELFLIILIIALFLGILFINIYFRVKVMKSYKYLVQNRVEFDASHLINAKKLEEEVLPNYPEHKDEIITFISHIKFSMKCASILIFLITAFGAVLMYYRE